MSRKQGNRIFPNAETYPSFFATNLQDPNRVIKVLNGRNSVIRAFYYQLLKLIFELDVMKDGLEIDYAKILNNIVNQCISKIQDKEKSSYLKLKAGAIDSFIKRFLENQQFQFQPFLQTNQQVDRAFVDIFQEIIKQVQLDKSSVQQIFGYFCQIFDLRVSQIQKCIRFQESDVFIYIQNDNQMYLAFVNLEQDQNHSQNSLDKVMNSKKSFQKNPTKTGKAQNDTIINIFGDMLHNSKFETDSKVSNSFLTNNLNNSQSPSKKQDETFGNIQKNMVKPSKMYSNEVTNLGYMGKKEVQEYVKTNDDSNFIKNNQSMVERYHQSSKQAPTNDKRKSPQRTQSPDDILYRPKSKLPTLNTISQVTASRQSLFQSRQKKKDLLDYADQDEKGTFYRQFTNTRILNILPQPQRTSVRMLKNRFIGVHSKNFKKQ